MAVDKRRLLNDCADLYVICDDGSQIPCSKFHVSTRCAILHWVTEDTAAKTIPFPNIDPETLRLALDVVHDLTSLDQYTLPQVEAAARGFDVLGCRIDPCPRIWQLLCSIATIDQLRPWLPRLLRSPNIKRAAVIHRAVALAPQFQDILETIRACEPDVELGAYLAVALAKFVPVGPLVIHLLQIVSNLQTEDALRIAGCDGLGTYTHPWEVGVILAHLRDHFSFPNETWRFITSMGHAMQTFDAAPMSTSNMFGSVLMFHDAQSTSVLLNIDGQCPPRRIVITKWLKFSLIDKPVATVKAYAIDEAAKRSRCLDVRMFVDTGCRHTGHRQAEMWYSWVAPTWHPSNEVSTDACEKTTGDKRLFDTLVETGLFAQKMTIRVDIFYGTVSALDSPPLF